MHSVRGTDFANLSILENASHATAMTVKAGEIMANYKHKTLTIRTLALITVLAAGNACATTTFATITVSQRPGTQLVDIAYDVSSSLTNVVTVSLVVSNATGLVTATYFTGDIGDGVAAGTGRKIVWNGGADQNGQNLSSLRVSLTASDSSTPPPAGMVAIPSGTFLMGLLEASQDANPQHTVTLSAFTMDKMEVAKSTWEQVASWASTHGYDIGKNSAVGKASTHPVAQMTWFSALKWCNARSEMEGLTPCYTNTDGSVYRTGTFNGSCNWAANGYRLPSEAEWEYAARGGAAEKRFPWSGSDEIKHVWANYRSSSGYTYDTSETRGFHPDYSTSEPYTSPVGSFAPNGYGLYDMAGNVYEWCWDWHSATYYSGSSDHDPKGPSSPSDETNRVIRGGSAYNYATFSKVGYRSKNSPDGTGNHLGFRTVRTALPSGGTVATSALFNVDFRDYNLTVASAFGTPAPAVGNTTFAWHTTITGTVQSVVSANGTNWTCTGWIGVGLSPSSGSTSTNTGALLLTDVASTLTWKWTVSAYQPIVTAQPQSCTKTYADTAVFSVGATGLPAATYQWRRNGVNVTNDSRISGAQSNTLTIKKAQLSDAGEFSVVVANDMGSVTSQAAVLTMNKAVLTVKANNVIRTYNTPNPSLTTTITGFLNNDTASVVSGSPILSTTATVNSNVDTYPINVSQGFMGAANYSFSLVSGTLTVNKATQTINFDLPRVIPTDQVRALDAVACSGLPVTCRSDNESVALVANGRVTTYATGTAILVAEQLGNENYRPAEHVSKALLVVNPGFEEWAASKNLESPLADTFALDRNGDGICNGFEYAFGTNLVAGAQALTLRMINGRPVVEIPQQDETTKDYVDVRVEGCTNLLDTANGWTLQMKSASDTSGKPSCRAWYEPETAPANAFFRLKVGTK